MPEIKSTCCYCGVGCGVIIETEERLDGARIVGVRGDPTHPANFGRLCTKGSTLHLTVQPQTLALRALHPELRQQRDSPRCKATWDEALEHVASRFAAIIERHGPDSVAFYISGQLLTEDYYVFNKLAKGLIGTNNIDSNSRLCMSSAASGYKATLGADAPPCCYEDIVAADCLLIAGSNAAYAHPVLFRRIEEAKQARPDLKIIVVDPRRTDTAEAADLHLPILPGSDVALYNAMLHVMLWEGLLDQDFIRRHTEGFEDSGGLKDLLREYTPGVAAEICGLGARGADDIVKAARMFGESPRALSLYCQGLNQSAHGTDNNAALIHLHLATGKIGRTGCGPFSLTGQPNAMGGREVGGMATLLSAHRDLDNPAHRAEVARLWGVGSVPAKPGKTAVELFAALKSGEVKAVWIAGTNPAQSLPDLNEVHDALRAAEFVVVQDSYAQTDTTAFADVLLPASSWGEKEGSVTNSERRISHVLPAVPPPGEARADWQIAVDFAVRLGGRLGRQDLAQRMFNYASAERIFDEHRETTRGRDLDISALSYGLLDAQGPQQWPYPAGASSGRQRLYEDGLFPTVSGRARFIPTRHVTIAEAIDARYPLHLTSGRLRDQWHGMSRSGSVARLFAHQPEPLLEMHAQDMARRGLSNGDLVRASGRRGELTARVQSADSVASGQVFMAMHWGGQYMNGMGVNALSCPSFDPVSKQPELKHAAIQVGKLEAAETLYEIVAMRRVAPGEATAQVQALRTRLQPWLSNFVYATLTLAGREDPVLVLRAYTSAFDATLLAALDRELGFDDEKLAAHALTFNDARRQVMKRALIEDGILTGVRLAGETAACGWLQDLMARGAPTQAVRQWLLAPLTQPPLGEKSRGKVVCNCFDVAEDEILADLSSGLDLPALQAKRACGTQCGSCLPELKRLLGMNRKAV